MKVNKMANASIAEVNRRAMQSIRKGGENG